MAFRKRQVTWEQCELEFLKSNQTRLHPDVMAEALGKSVSAVWNMLHVLRSKGKDKSSAPGLFAVKKRA